MPSRSLIVMPEDTDQPLLDAINGARSSIRVKIFLFSDPSLVAAVIAAHQRGVKVRVMLNPARRGGEAENEATRKALEEAGVAVADTNPAIDLTHEKSMVVDDETAFIQSLNWETKNLTATRDYAVVTSHRHEVDEVSACFDASRRHPDDLDILGALISMSREAGDRQAALRYARQAAGLLPDDTELKRLVAELEGLNSSKTTDGQ